MKGAQTSKRRRSRRYGGTFRRSYTEDTNSGGGFRSSSLLGKEDHPLRDNHMGFTSTDVRHGFIRKVYAIVFLQLALTFGLILPFAFSKTLRRISHKMSYLMLVFWCLSLVILIALACGPQSLRRKFPLNIGLLLCFTVLFALSIAFTIGAAYERYSGWIVVFAMVTTLAISALFTVFAMQTRIDMTRWGGILFLLFIAFYVLAVGWAIMAVVFVRDKETFNIMEIVVASLGVLVFIGLLMYDTQLLLGGNHKYAISPEDYVMGAIAIYLDIINIFLLLLRIFAAAKGLSDS